MSAHVPRRAPTEADTLRAFQFCRRASPGDNFYKHAPCVQCTALAEYGLQEQARAHELLVADFQRLSLVVGALEIEDVIRMIRSDQIAHD